MTQESRMDRLEVRMDGLGNRLDHLTDDVQQLREDFRSLRSEISSRFNTLYLIAFGNVATTILTAVGIVIAVLFTR